MHFKIHRYSKLFEELFQESNFGHHTLNTKDFVATIADAGLINFKWRGFQE